MQRRSCSPVLAFLALAGPGWIVSAAPDAASAATHLGLRDATILVSDAAAPATGGMAAQVVR